MRLGLLLEILQIVLATGGRRNVILDLLLKLGPFQVYSVQLVEP